MIGFKFVYFYDFMRFEYYLNISNKNLIILFSKDTLNIIETSFFQVQHILFFIYFIFSCILIKPETKIVYIHNKLINTKATIVKMINNDETINTL